jgi:hypothetical protein
MQPCLSAGRLTKLDESPRHQPSRTFDTVASDSPHWSERYASGRATAQRCNYDQCCDVTGWVGIGRTGGALRRFPDRPRAERGSSAPSTARCATTSSTRPTRRARCPLTFTTDLGDFADRDLVIEAVAEHEPTKAESFRTPDKVVVRDAILVYNASSTPIMNSARPPGGPRRRRPPLLQPGSPPRARRARDLLLHGRAHDRRVEAFVTRFLDKQVTRTQASTPRRRSASRSARSSGTAVRLLRRCCAWSTDRRKADPRGPVVGLRPKV